jgi:hypothetical protein
VAIECAAGEEEIVGMLTPYNNRVCRSCILGLSFKSAVGQVFSSFNTAARFSYEIYFWRGQVSRCLPVVTCLAGEEEFALPTLSSNRVCVPCAAGTFKSLAGQTMRCARWRTCGAGSEPDPLSPASASSDAVCRACNPETFKPLAGMNACTPAIDCDLGSEEALPPSLFSDRVCRACLLGVTFKSTAGHAAQCSTVTTCLAGAEPVSSPTLSSDRQCASCQVGVSFKAVIGQASCTRVTMVCCWVGVFKQ